MIEAVSSGLRVWGLGFGITRVAVEEGRPKGLVREVWEGFVLLI